MSSRDEEGPVPTSKRKAATTDTHFHHSGTLDTCLIDCGGSVQDCSPVVSSRYAHSDVPQNRWISRRLLRSPLLT